MKGQKKEKHLQLTYLQNNQALHWTAFISIEKDYPNVKVGIKAPETSGWVQFFTGIIPFIIIIILFFFLLSQSQGGGNKVMNFGKVKAKLI